MAERAVVEQGINWVLSFVIGIVAIGFGIYLFADSSNATTLIAAIIAFALLLGSLIHLLQGLRRNANEFAARAALLSGGVGVTVGAIVCLDLFYDYLSSPAARIILASGLIVYGVLGLSGMIVQRVEGTVVRTIVTCAFALAFAALLISNSQDDQLNTNWFAVALIVTGLLLLGLGFFARNHQARLLQDRRPATAPATGPTADPATRADRTAPGRRESREGTGPVTAAAGSRAGGGKRSATGDATTVPAEPERAPIVGQAPAGIRLGDAADSAASHRPAGQPGQDTRSRLLEEENARRSGTGSAERP